jgi:hypothetical protein
MWYTALMEKTKTKFRLDGRKLYYGPLVVQVFEERGEALAVMNCIEGAFDEGYTARAAEETLALKIINDISEHLKNASNRLK